MKKRILVSLFLLAGIRSAFAQCTADAGPNQLLTCLTTEVVLQGSSNIPGATYAWSGPGGFTSTEQNPAVLVPGPYSLTITDPSDGCTATASTTVLQDIAPPTVSATGGILTCAISSISLNINTIPDFIPWYCDGPQTFSYPAQPIVTQPGVYQIVATNPANGCTANMMVTVAQDIDVPIATASGGMISCQSPILTLNGTGSSTGLQFSYIWDAINGNIVSGANTLTPVVNAAGIYRLTVFNNANGCSSTAMAEVTGGFTPVDLSASGGTVGCTPADITLTASSNTAGVTFVWSGPNNFNSFLQNPVLLNAGPLNAGLYTVIAVEPVNGCSATATVEVTIGPDVPRVEEIITNPSCNNDPSGAIILAASGGTPPYTYAWAGPNLFTSTTKDITGLIAGIYQLTITDVTGCSNVQQFTVVEPALLVLTPDITPVSCNGGSDGSVSVEVSGGNGLAFAYLWSNGSNANVLFGVPAGTYTLTVTDAGNCTALLQVQVPEPEPLTSPGVLICENSVSLQIAGGVLPYFVVWRIDNPNGPVIATGTSPTGLFPGGTYYPSVLDGNNCAFQPDPVTLSPGNTLPCTRVTGRVILDENQNCAPDSVETGLSNWFLKAEGPNGTFYGLSDASGQYHISLLPGDYTVTLFPKGAQDSICQNDFPVALVFQGEVDTLDFLARPAHPACASLSVSLASSALRRCFDTNYYHVNYCNDGPGAAEDVYVDVSLDPLMTIVITSVPYTDLGNHLYRFQAGDLAPGDCGVFWIRTKLSCDAILGQTHCAEAHIYPDTPCDPADSLWSGALLEVTSVCDGDSLDFILKNTGLNEMGQALEYIVIEDGIMTYQGMAPPLGAGESMTVSVPANGSTWRMEARQEPLAPVQSEPVLSVEGCTTTGSFSTGFVNQFPVNDESPFVDILCRANTASYDPNDKQGFPEGFGAKHYVRPGTELEYLIRFQNTGNDTAFTVVIRDTLSEWLDPITVQAGASSHPYRFELTGKGVLIFDFQNILLPDSNVNEPASHGFVQYRIRPRADAPLETDIFNSAAIYFDFNDPIITNATVHRIGENFISVGFWEPRKPAYTVSVYPQPLSDAACIEVKGPAGAARLRIFDQTGRQALALDAAEPRFLLRRGDLPAGMYFFRVEMDGAVIGSGKLIAR